MKELNVRYEKEGPGHASGGGSNEGLPDYGGPQDLVTRVRFGRWHTKSNVELLSWAKDMSSTSSNRVQYSTLTSEVRGDLFNPIARRHYFFLLLIVPIIKPGPVRRQRH